MHFNISYGVFQISLCISESQDSGPAEVEYLYLSAAGVEARAEQRKDAMLASVRVGSLGLRDLSGLSEYGYRMNIRMPCNAL